jgi:DNA replication protein DnaC
MPDLSNAEDQQDNICRICGAEAICEGLGLIRYDVPYGDPRFGKLFRCPNNPIEADLERQDRLRKIGNLSAFADKVFQNFTIDPNVLKPLEITSLQRAYEESVRFADNPENWLLLEGPYGCGKTHLAAAIGNERLRRGEPVVFITVPDLLDHLRSAYGPSSEMGYDETFDRVRDTPMLILDDLGTENSSPWAKEKLFQLFNHRYSKRLPTVITTNIDLDTLDGRIRSRLLDVEVHRVKIIAPDYRTAIQNQKEQLISNLAIYRDMTFETFQIQKYANQAEKQILQDAVEGALSYAQKPKDFFILMGPYSVGKTHLAASIANYRQLQGTDVSFVTVPDLLDYLRFAYNPQATVSFDYRFQMIRNSPFLVLDDLGTENSSPWAKEKLFQIIDHRYVAHLPTVITTAKRLDDIDPRIRSRLIDERRSKFCVIGGVENYPSRINRRKS